MAITVEKADLNRTLYRAVLLAGLQNPDYDVPAVKEDAPFTLADFKEAVILSDVEKAQIIADTLDHPYRSAFFTETPVILKHGDLIPPSLAAHSRIIIGIDNDDDDDVETETEDSIEPSDDFDDRRVIGRIGRNRQHIEKARKCPGLFGRAEGLYFIEHSRIYFVGSEARVYSPTIPVDRNRTTLLCPDSYSNGIIAGAYKMLYMNGQDYGQRMFYLQQSEMFDARIKNKDLDLPKPERFQQFNG